MKRGYSLIELGVVLSVIAFIALATLPTLTSTSDNQAVQTAANNIRQLLLDAKTRSLAPEDTTDTGVPSVFQVSFGPFTKGAATSGVGKTVTSDEKTSNTVALYQGLSVCSDIGSISSSKLVRELPLPRNVYISKFFPTNQNPNTNSAIQFTVGKVGYQCGESSNPAIESANFASGYWQGKSTDGGVSAISARYAVIEVSLYNANAKRYVYVDRQNSEIFVSREDPQATFTPLSDTFAPSAPSSIQLSVTCGATSSQAVLSFVRSLDVIGQDDSGADITSLSAPVYYDIKIGTTMLASKVYLPINGTVPDEVMYFYFSTDLVSLAQSENDLVVGIKPYDADGNTLAETTSVVNPSCGNSTAITTDATPPAVDQTDPGVRGEQCVTRSIKNPIWSFIVGRALAVTGENCSLTGSGFVAGP